MKEGVSPRWRRRRTEGGGRRRCGKEGTTEVGGEETGLKRWGRGEEKRRLKFEGSGGYGNGGRRFSAERAEADGGGWKDFEDGEEGGNVGNVMWRSFY